MNWELFVWVQIMTNGMVERYQTSSSATMMGYDYHHQDGSSSLSGVFDAAFSAAASTSSRRGYAPANYDGMMANSSTMHQVFFGSYTFPVCSSFSCRPPSPAQQVAIE